MTVIAILASILFFSSVTPAAAYIDPVTGSIVLQALIGGFAAALVAIRSVREKIVNFFRKKPVSEDAKSEAPSE